MTLLQTSPAATAGAKIGIDGYGDSADIAVPADGSDVWVDLSIHPTGILIKNQATGSGSSITYVNRATGASTNQSVDASLHTDPQDRFFYTSDSRLYYFNYFLNSVYEWPDIHSPLVTATAAFDGVLPGIQIYAICPDPAYADYFYVVGRNTTAPNPWELYVVYLDPSTGTPTWCYSGDITADLEYGRAGASPSVSVTGVAADPYGYAYVSFYNTPAGGGTPVSGIVSYDSYAYPNNPNVAQYIPDTTAAWTSADSIFTDVTHTGSNFYVLASPNTTTGQASDQYSGTADVFIFDTSFVQLSTNPSLIAHSHNGTVSLTGGGLVLPNKFTGMIQGGTFFVSQTDFAAAPNLGAPEYLSAVSLDLSSVTSVP